MKIEMGNEITPQALDKLDQEYQNITKKYSTLAGKSQLLFIAVTGSWLAVKIKRHILISDKLFKI